ncbi:MAG: HD domain-containing phosphohydrolase, partial [Thermodesulfovibrionales bacterium]|nr:HD domain-containing phosphohydrolase [Thermodesulfovibrionales bacterium]
HERLDGTGYPDGLKGDEIPRQAQMLAVADAFDSMTAERPYRETPGREKAIEELKKNAGTQFDPKVVEAFLKILKTEGGN